MDKLGKLELEIINSFEKFSDLIEKIQNRPEFKSFERNGVNIPKYDKEELKQASIGAGVLLGGLGGAAAGTAGGFAAAGATTAAVMALGTASTGTAIASLSGVAATNATLAALGGGAIAAGGGGMALGTAILGGATLGVGLLVGGIIFSATGDSLNKKAAESWDEMLKAEKEINEVVSYLNKLKTFSNKYRKALSKIYDIYKRQMDIVDFILHSKTDWYEFSYEEQTAVENLVMCAALLYHMCKVQLVCKADNENELNEINKIEINDALADADNFINGFSCDNKAD